jgi:hypothetical protein
MRLEHHINIEFKRHIDGINSNQLHLQEKNINNMNELLKHYF